MIPSREKGWKILFHAITSLPKIRHTVCQLSGVSTRFRVYHPCLYVAHRNTYVKGGNFVINCHKTLVNTLKSIVLHSNVHTQSYFWFGFSTYIFLVQKESMNSNL